MRERNFVLLSSVPTNTKAVIHIGSPSNVHQLNDQSGGKDAFGESLSPARAISARILGRYFNKLNGVTHNTSSFERPKQEEEGIPFVCSSFLLQKLPLKEKWKGR